MSILDWPVLISNYMFSILLEDYFASFSNSTTLMALEASSASTIESFVLLDSPSLSSLNIFSWSTPLSFSAK